MSTYPLSVEQIAYVGGFVLLSAACAQGWATWAAERRWGRLARRLEALVAEGDGDLPGRDVLAAANEAAEEAGAPGLFRLSRRLYVAGGVDDHVADYFESHFNDLIEGQHWLQEVAMLAGLFLTSLSLSVWMITSAGKGDLAAAGSATLTTAFGVAIAIGVGVLRRHLTRFVDRLEHNARRILAAAAFPDDEPLAGATSWRPERLLVGGRRDVR